MALVSAAPRNLGRALEVKVRMGRSSSRETLGRGCPGDGYEMAHLLLGVFHIRVLGDDFIDKWCTAISSQEQEGVTL